MSETEQPTWRSRIIGHGFEDPNQLLANPKNWRIHPGHQQRALNAVLDRVGWVQHVIVNRETGFVIDGHLRVAMSISRSEPAVPVSYVELSDTEEDLVLAGLDPLSSLAEADPEALDRIIAADTEGELQMLFAPEDSADGEGGIDWGARPEGDTDARWIGYAVGEDPDEHADDDPDQPGRTYLVMCPECGEEFQVFVAT
jgi:hypothetical protein